MEDSVLKINSISKSYKKTDSKANDNITLSFKKGEITALIGHNGAGKSTLLNQIIGTIRPDNGDITYANHSFVKKPKIAREHVSIMPQIHAPISGVTISQALESIMRIKGATTNEMENSIPNILKELKIEKWKDTVGDKLSGGLCRLTSFAMTIAKPSDIILLDEPTNDVDPIRRQLIWKYLKKLSDNGHIIIIVTHNLLEVEQYANRYIMFDQGKIIKDELAQSLNNNFSTNLLIIDTNDNDLINSENFPEAVNKEKLEDGKLMITLSLEQMESAFAWLLQMIKENKVFNYKLLPASLDISYGGILDE